ncbi:putative protein-serine/threonine phosphatase [Medicago truncatula]|uniref:protein-serine/threonine phosphatase n=1 Tax=Medicago truncatula TaxID=3880 RepID=A0A396IHA1_MEDTR|nr:putative protein-serine/threonine phosphatase [Medicago truncatula]
MVSGSFLNCNKSKKNLEVMVKEVEDVEEGEISDTSSVKVIIEKDLNKVDHVVKVDSDVKSNNNNIDKIKTCGNSRVLDLQNFYSSCYYASGGGLYNLAWAQAVQNKPLNDIFAMEIDKDTDVNVTSNTNSNNNDDLNKPLKEVIFVDDDDKEEGELEEGEIDVDDDTNCAIVGGGDSFENVSESDVIGVRDVLKCISVANVSESFAETCTRIQSALQSKVFSGIAGSEKDDLVCLLFNAVEVVYSIHAMITLVDVSGNSEANSEEKKLEALDETRKILGLRHDLDNLPSLTQEVPVNKLFSVGDGTDRFGLPPVKTEAEKMELDGKDYKLHIHETDALKAASTCQQKFSRSSFFTDDEFPSPTPSGDCEGGAVDTNDEVSSASIASSLTSSKPPPLDQMLVSSTYINRSNMHGLINSRIDASGAGSYPAKTSVKSRDPRLRFNISDQSSTKNIMPKVEYAEGVISRKRKTVEESSLDATAPKRLTRSLENSQHNSREEQTMDAKGGWLAENTVASNLTTTSNGNEQAPVISSCAATPLLALFNSESVNSTMLLNKLLDIHQRLAEVKRPINFATSALHLTNSNSARGTNSTVNTSPTMTSGVPQNSIGMLPTSSPTTSMAQTLQVDSEKICLKPRDPRRSLHASSTVQKSGSLGSKQSKAIVSPMPNIKGSAHETCASGSCQPHNTWAANVEHLLEGYDAQQKAVIQRERARRLEEQNKMFAARKLCLVLDIDHTLLNSAKFVEVDPEHDKILRKKEKQERGKPRRHLFRLPHMGMWTKLRPGVWNFLEKASKLFEMHLYTMGNKLYATEMAKVLDPNGVLFAGRVISRGDDPETVDIKCKDLEGVLGLESSVVIIDDSPRVWPHNQLNLITVERYIYFLCSRRQFGLSGPSLFEIDHDERPGAGTLASSLGVIERIHQNFFASQSLEEMDVRNILASEQRKILGGCRIVFSGVFPVGETNPHLHPLWRTAEQFGASCTNKVDPQVTHVVAQSPGTDKVNWGISNGKFVVYPNWVEASTLLYRRMNEQDFAVKTEKQPPNKIR